MTAVESAADLSTEVQALLLKAVISEAEKVLAPLEKRLRDQYPFPTTVPFESPLDGACLGRVTRARSNPQWVVTSREQVEEYFTREYPAVLETVFALDVPGLDQPVMLAEDHPITVALAGSAPDLLTPVRRVPPQIVEDALTDARDNGATEVPGINLVRKGPGALSIVPDKKEGPAAISRMVRAGLVSLPQLALLGEPAAVEKAS